MKKVLSIVFLVVMVATMFVGCAKGAETTAADAAETKDYSDELYIGVYCLGDLEYFYDHKIGLAAAGKMMGVQTKYVGPPDYDIDAMVTAFEQAIAEEPAGIITFGAEVALAPVIDKAEAAGIPVITVDGDVSSSSRTAFVGTGNYAAGYLGGSKLAEALDGKGKVIVLTEPGVELHNDRAQGYQDALDEFSDIEVVQVGDTKADPVHTLQIVAAMLQQYPDSDRTGCTDAVGGAASSTAVEEAGLAGKVKIISMDRDRQVLEKIGEDVITGTIVQKSAMMPFYALQILFAMRHADVEISTDNSAAGITLAPNSIDTGVIYVDKSNAEFFIRD